MLVASLGPRRGGESGGCARCFGTELAAALHHSRDARSDVAHEALRGQKTASSGMRLAPPEEVSEPQVWAVTVGYVAAPVHLVSSPMLAGGDATDDVTVAFLVAASLEEKKDEEEKARVRRQREAAEHEARMQELDRRVQDDVLLSPAESRAWMRWAGHLPPKKRKKRRKRKLPRNSSRPRLAAQHLGRYGPEGLFCRDTQTASVARAVRTWKPGLSTSHWNLAPCSVPVTPEEHRKIWSFLGVHYAELIISTALCIWQSLCGVFYDPTVSCSEFALGVQEHGFFWKTTSGMVFEFSTPWFDSGYMLGGSLRRLSASTLQKTLDSSQLQFIEGRRHPCLYADAVPNGPDCSENHRDSPVARRHDGRCLFRAGYTGSHVQVVGGTVVLPQFLFVEKIAVSYEDVDIPTVMQRPIRMVQRWTIEISRPLLAHSWEREIVLHDDVLTLSHHSGGKNAASLKTSSSQSVLYPVAGDFNGASWQSGIRTKFRQHTRGRLFQQRQTLGGTRLLSTVDL